MQHITNTSTPFDLNYKISKIPMADSITALKCQIKLEGNFSSSMEKHIVIVLDNSGSMGGSAMNFAKEGVKELIDYLHHGGSKKISLIVYNSTAEVHYLHSLSLEDCKLVVDNIKATGRTSFSDAFEKIKTVIQAIPCKQLCIVFFTDGQDTCNTPEKVQTDCDALGRYIQEKTLFSETHTIGFTADHDALLLSRITTMGKNQGTFQYCKSSKDIPVCVDSVAGLIGGQTITARVLFNHKAEPLQLDLEEISMDTKSREYECLFYIESQGITPGGSFDLVVNVDSESAIKVIMTDDIAIDEEGKAGVLILQLGLIKTEVNKIIKEAVNLKLDSNVDAKGIQNLMAKLEKEEKELEKYMADLGKSLKTSQRKDVFPMVQEIKDLIADFYSTLRSLQKGQINNDTIASLNALAYKGITKKGLQKKLDKRTQQNVNLINDVYSRVSQAVEKIDFNAMKEKYADLSSKLGDCVLSCNSFIEALADEDCLCLTFDIGRSQAAIADPTQVLIKTVFPSFITAGSFMYSAQFSIKKNAKAHGGFEKHAEGLIVKGAAQENITGVMPLYICEENWKVAKLIMKPTLGWTTTLDPLGYAYSQIKIIPFLIMVKLLQMLQENPGSDFLKFQLQLVKDTCIQIIKDGSNPKFEPVFSEEIRTIFDNYVKDPAVRTADIIAHNGVFLCQLYCAMEAGLIEKKSPEYMEDFVKYLIEEELRRRQLNWKQQGDADGNEAGEVVDVTSLLFKLLNVDVQKYIEEPVAEFFEKKKDDANKESSLASSSEYEKKMLQAVAYNKMADMIEKEREEEVKANSPSKNQEERKTSDSRNNPHMKDLAKVEFEYSLKKEGGYNNYQHKALQEYQETMKRVMKYLEPLINLFIAPKANADKFKTWDIVGDTKFFCLYIQNKLHGKNSVRREAIVSKNYKNPWTEDQEFIQHWYQKLVEDEKSRRITQFLCELEGQKSSANAKAFINATNLTEAAGAFMGTYVGKDINHFYKTFMKAKVPLAREKIEMMVTGHFKGVKLYKDQEEWRPSRTHANGIWRMNKQAFTAEEWKTLMPSVSYRFIKGEAKCPPPDQRNKLKQKKKAVKSKK